MCVSGCLYLKLSVWLRNHRLEASFIILFCSITVRVFLTWQATTAPENLIASIPDAATYLAPAQSLLAQGVFHDYSGAPDVTRTPGYPTFLAVIIYVVGQNLRAVLVAQAIILSSSILLLYWLSSKILPPVMAFTAGLVAAVSPWGSIWAGLPLSDGLFLFLLALIFATIRIIEESRSLPVAWFGALGLGVLTAYAVLTRPILPLVFLVGLVVIFRYGITRQGRWVVITTMLVCASAPLLLWQARNRHEGELNGISDIAGKTVWRYLASRVRAEGNGQNRWVVSKTVYEEEQNWRLSNQAADNERWRQAMAVFRQYPFLTVYCFFRSAIEHGIHPSPDILVYPKLNFNGDFVALASLWAALLIFGAFGGLCKPESTWDDGVIDRPWLMTMLTICGLLTLSSGISFGAGSRLRAPLELIIPLLASVGLVRTVHGCLHVSFRCPTLSFRISSDHAHQ